MTRLGQLLDDLDRHTVNLVRTQPSPDGSAAIISAWPPLSDAAARTLVRVPTLDGRDDPGLFRALVDLAHQRGHSTPSSAFAPHTEAYRAIGAHLDGQPRATGSDVQHARVLQGRLLQPLNVLAEWSGYYAGHAAPAMRYAFDELARSSRTPVASMGTRYADLGVLDPHATDPILRSTALWASEVTASLQPDRLSTSGLRATLGDLNIAFATAYYLTKTTMLGHQIDPVLGSSAANALWDARNEWRTQARMFPRDLRLGDLISTERNTMASMLRDTYKAAFQEPNGDWLPPGRLLATFDGDTTLRYARALTDACHTIGGRYVTALEQLQTLPLRRVDHTYEPVFPVGTDLAEVRRERLLPVAAWDPELRQLRTRARVATGLSSRALDAVRDTALNLPGARELPAMVRPEPTASIRDLKKVIATLDAMIPAAHHRHGHINPGSRPAWANGNTPPESLPDIRGNRTLRRLADGSRTRPATPGIRP